MKIKYLFLLLIFLNSCVGTGTSGLFGTGVSVAVDPRSIGTQIDDTIMQKNLSTRLTLEDKNYFLAVKSKVLDGRIFITGKVDNPEDKLKITKIAWETEGVRSVRNDIKIKEKFNFLNSSHVYSSKSAGFVGDDFLNQVTVCLTDLKFDKVISTLKAIESTMGRKIEKE